MKATRSTFFTFNCALPPSGRGHAGCRPSDVYRFQSHAGSRNNQSPCSMASRRHRALSNKPNAVVAVLQGRSRYCTTIWTRRSRSTGLSLRACHPTPRKYNLKQAYLGHPSGHGVEEPFRCSSVMYSSFSWLLCRIRRTKSSKRDITFFFAGDRVPFPVRYGFQPPEFAPQFMAVLLGKNQPGIHPK